MSAFQGRQSAGSAAGEEVPVAPPPAFSLADRHHAKAAKCVVAAARKRTQVMVDARRTDLPALESVLRRHIQAPCQRPIVVRQLSHASGKEG